MRSSDPLAGNIRHRRRGMKSVELKDLIGLHTLSAVEIGYMQDNGGDTWRGMEQCNYISFTLDGKTYTAIEDPDDGYRSSMDRIVVSKRKLKNVVPGTKVLAVPARERYLVMDSLLVFYAADNGEIVMEVGTDSNDAYYPVFVGNFRPEKLPANKSKEGGKE
jgi:hypothetical protein